MEKGARRSLMSVSSDTYLSFDVDGTSDEKRSSGLSSRLRAGILPVASALLLVGALTILLLGHGSTQESGSVTSPGLAAQKSASAAASAGKVHDPYIDYDGSQKDFAAVQCTSESADDRDLKDKTVEKASEMLDRIIADISDSNGHFNRVELEQRVESDNTSCWFDEAVFKHKPDRAYESFTLFTQIQEANGPQWTFLVDMYGRLVHSWYHAENPVTKIVKFLDNGNLMRMTWAYQKYFEGTFDAASYIEEVSWDGTIEHKCHVANETLTAHHDVWKTKAGTYLVPSWKIVSEAYCKSIGLNEDSIMWNGMINLQKKRNNGGCMIDGLVEYKPQVGGGVEDCEKVWEWWMDDHVVQDLDSSALNYGNVSEHPELIDINFWAGEAAWPDTCLPQSLHVNSVHLNEELGQIMLSSFQKGEIYIIEHTSDTATAKGHSGGKYGMGGDILFRAGNPKAYQRDATLMYNDCDLGGKPEHQIYRLFYKCHTAHWIEEGLPGAGNVLVFSNGFGNPPNAHPNALWSSAVEFSIPVVGGKKTSDSNPPAPDSDAQNSEDAPVPDDNADEKVPEPTTSPLPPSPGHNPPESEDWLSGRRRLQMNNVKVGNPTDGEGKYYTSAKYPEGRPDGTELTGLNGTYGMAQVQKGERPFLGIGLVWQWNDYSHSQVTHFGGVQRLPNGNTFVTMSSTNTGFRFIEVTPEGEAVWNFRPDYESMPETLTQGYARRTVYRAYRYDKDHPALKDKDLSGICKPPLKDRMMEESRFDLKVKGWTTSRSIDPFPEPSV